MKIVSITLSIILASMSIASQAQQLGLYNMYNQNTYLINPASAGLNGCFNGFVNHRTQWSGLDGSPTYSGVTLDGRFGNSHGVGGNIQFAEVGLLSQFSGKVTYAYHLQVGKGSYLHAGISMGAHHQRFNTNDIIATDYSDQVLLQGRSEWTFANDLGIMFTTARLRAGIALPQTFDLGQQISSGSKENINVYAAYDIISNDIWKLEGSALYRNNSNQEDYIDLGAKMMWKRILGLGAIYRSGFGTAAIAELNINNQYVVAYSYDFGGSNAVSNGGGSHGFMLGVKLCRKNPPKPKKVRRQVEEPPATPVEPEIEETPVVEPEVIAEVVEEPVVPAKEEPEPVQIDSVNQVFAHRDQMIRFEHASDQNVISDNQMRVVNQVAGIMKENPNIDVHIVGHASSVGAAEFNRQLSERRAKLIADALIDKGIAPSRITQIGRGEDDPIADKSTAYGAAENRRVQVIFIVME